MKAARLLLRPADGAFPGIDEALAALEDVRRDQLVNLEWLADGSYAMLYELSADTETTIESVLTDHHDIHQYDLVRAGDHTIYAFVHVAERDSLSTLLAITERHAILLDPPFSFTDDGVVVTVTGHADALQAAFAEATEQIDLDVQWSGTYEPDAATPFSLLTDRQRQALRAAYDLGFYENPRQTNYEEIGNALQCAPSTANELLRRAEATLVAAVIDR